MNHLAASIHLCQRSLICLLHNASSERQWWQASHLVDNKNNSICPRWSQVSEQVTDEKLLYILMGVIIALTYYFVHQPWASSFFSHNSAIPL